MEKRKLTNDELNEQIKNLYNGAYIFLVVFLFQLIPAGAKGDYSSVWAFMGFPVISIVYYGMIRELRAELEMPLEKRKLRSAPNQCGRKKKLWIFSALLLTFFVLGIVFYLVTR